MPLIDQKTIDEIYSRADIVEVVSEFVSLRKAGANYKGLCPFHNERTPSFSVSPSRGICHCFSCGKGGNVVHFLMEHEQMSYPETLRWLAKKYNITIKEKELTAEEIEARGHRESLFIVNEWANQYFIDNLYNSEDGRTYGLGYLRGRGLRDDIITKFQLGYCLPQKNAMSNEAMKKGYNPDYLVETGLCSKNDNGGLYDKYHGRVIFPVHNLSGKVVAFGGRILGNEKAAKYINSSESEIYHKSYELYGIHQAKRAITKEDRCYLVEGYMDVISMHQSGIENVVASSGTSLTDGQIKMLHRFTNNITVLYDGDPAGIHASLRGINMLLAEGMNIKVLLLPDGDDPDSFARKHNAQEYQEYIESHQEDFLSFKVRILLADAKNDIQKRAEVTKDIIESISLIPDAITRHVYIQECSRMMNMKEEVLVREIGRKRKDYIENKKKEEAKQDTNSSNEGTQDAEQKTPLPVASPSAASHVMNNQEKIELSLIRTIIRYGEQIILTIPLENGEYQGITVIEYIDAEFTSNNLSFTNNLFKRIWEDAKLHCNDEGFQASNHFISSPDIEVSKLAADMINSNYQLSQWYAKEKTIKPTEEKLSTIIPSLIMHLKLAIISDKLKETMTQLEHTDASSENYMKLFAQYNNLQKIKKELAQQCS